MIMKQMRVLSLAATAALTVSLLAGCGGSETANTPAPGSSDAPSGSSSAATIKIGGIGPLTGSAAVYGVATQQGAQLAVDEINAKGGLQFELNFQDDENDAEKATNAYNVLQDWGMQVLYGCTTTNPCVAVASSTYADRYFQLTPSASSTDVTSGKDNAFQICFTDPNQGSTAADYIAEHPELGSKIAIIYNNGDAYSTGIATAFRAEAEAKGLEVVSETTFPSDDNTDFSVQLGDAQSNGADLVFMPIYYTPASLILNQAKNMGYAPTFFGCDGMDGILQVENFDTKLAEGLMLLTPFAADAQDELTQKFVTSYKENYGETPIQFAADAYDAIYAIKAAMEEADITPETSVSDTCDKMKEAMLNIKVNGLTGEDMTWTEDGEPHKAPKAVKVVDGAYQAM